MSVPSIQCLTGSAIHPFIPDLARLRIDVFREYPYLYEGTLAYEEAYLEHYADSPHSCLILVVDEGRVVGASTGMPLEDYDEEMQAPFQKAGLDITRIFYLGESVLLPEFRGHGLGVRFFRERESHAKRVGRFETAAFCAVVRQKEDARRPVDYQPLDAFWQKRGYQKRPELLTYFSWQEMGETEESTKPMVFWTKQL